MALTHVVREEGFFLNTSCHSFMRHSIVLVGLFHAHLPESDAMQGSSLTSWMNLHVNLSR